MDEYQNYESAMNALREAQKILGKSSVTSESSRSRELSTKIEALEEFVSIQKAAESNPQAVVQLESLLRSSYSGLLKPRNIYSALFKVQVQHQLDSEALQTLDVMKSTVPRFMEYLDRETVKKFCIKCNISPDIYLSNEGNEADDMQDEIKEVIKREKK